MKMLALRLAILAALLLVMPSCKHKPLCEFHPHQAKVKGVFDWRDAPTANPKGMCVFFYPMEGEEAPMRRFLKTAALRVAMTSKAWRADMLTSLWAATA